LDRAQCVVKHQIWNNPFMRGVVKATNYIRNDDDPEKLIADCSRLLSEGNNLIIFPEGSRTVPGRPRHLQRGFVNIAVRSRSPVRLVTITCAPPMLRKGEKWYEIPSRRPQYTICAHELIDPRDFLGDDPPSVAVRRLTAHIGDRYGELLRDAQS
jgi:1-acyl-sn-glycerol-3-phosphate acyltransferase